MFGFQSGQANHVPSGGLEPGSGFDHVVPADNDDPQRWLGNTPLLQFDYPKIRLLATRLTQLQATPRQKALACVNYVSAMPFGAIADSTGTSALAVLKHGKGDCHTKSTLLVALLRAVRIPSRMRFISLPPDFLRGIIDNGDVPVEHACTEVYLDGRWLSLDSYVVDTKLAVAAKQRLRREGSKLGYGMHVDGSTSWNGSSHSFAQFSRHDAASKPLRDWGAYDDPYQFYSSVPFVKSRLNWSSRVKWVVGAKLVNRKVKELRESAGNTPARQQA